MKKSTQQMLMIGGAVLGVLYLSGAFSGTGSTMAGLGTLNVPRIGQRRRRRGVAGLGAAMPVATLPGRAVNPSHRSRYLPPD